MIVILMFVLMFVIIVSDQFQYVPAPPCLSVSVY